MNNNNLVKNWKKFLLEQQMDVMTQGDGDSIDSGMTADQIRIEKALIRAKKVEDYWSLGQIQARNREAAKKAKEKQERGLTKAEKAIDAAAEILKEGIIMAMEWFNPLDFLLNWKDGPQDLKDYHEDYMTAIKELDTLRIISSWQCMIVTGLSMLPLVTKGRKIGKIAVKTTERTVDLGIDTAVALFILFAEGAVKLLEATGAVEFEGHGRKLKQIIDNTKREIGYEGVDTTGAGDFDGGGASDSLEIDPESPDMTNRPRGRNQ